MSNYELYEKVLSSLDGDEGTFNAAARNWVEGAENAPFEDDDAKELFSTAKIACAAWRNKAINGRVSKIHMIECIRKIAEKNLPNPYPVEIREYGVDPEKVKLEDEPEAIQGVTIQVEEGKQIALETEAKTAEKVIEEVKSEPVHVLGVVPEEKPGLFKRKKR